MNILDPLRLLFADVGRANRAIASQPSLGADVSEARAQILKLARNEAGRLAYRKARSIGYCVVTAEQLQRAVESDMRDDESPAEAVARIVKVPHATGLVRA